MLLCRVNIYIYKFYNTENRHVQVRVVAFARKNHLCSPLSEQDYLTHSERLLKGMITINMHEGFLQKVLFGHIINDDYNQVSRMKCADLHLSLQTLTKEWPSELCTQ